jgi:hypothetical protein
MSASKPVWYNDVERDAWVEKHCRICHQPDQVLARIHDDGRPGCPYLARSMQNKMPTCWTRRRNAVMGDTFRCAAFIDKPPVNRRPVSNEETPPMFDDIEPDDYRLVPVDGWEDFRGKKKTKGGDHA